MSVSEFSAANNVILAFIFLFAYIGVIITILGLVSIVKGISRIFSDDDGSKISPNPLSNKIEPRVMPHQSIGLTGDSAKMIGCIYLFLGLTILLTVFFVYIKTGFVFIG